MKNYKPFQNCFRPIWTVPRDSPLLLGGEENVKLLFYEYLSVSLYKYMFQIITNKYMELNKTKAITGVPRPGPHSLYKYFTNAHPLLSNISRRKIIKYKFSMFLITF